MPTPNLLRIFLSVCLIAVLAAVIPMRVKGTSNLINDPSFEITKERDQFGKVFAKWEGWKWDGDCGFEVGEVAHTGHTSGLLVCKTAGKIRINQFQDLQPGRYRITAYIRGLDIGTGAYDTSTEFMFNEKYIQLKKNGNFGWTRLTYVADLDQAAKTGPSFGLWAPGYLWMDDVSMERVGTDVKLTAEPLLSAEEAPIAPPAALGPGAIHCPRCAYRNMPGWKKCYACGAPLSTGKVQSNNGPPEKQITSFEKGNPFSAGSVVAEHATEGTHSLRVDNQAIAMMSPQDWDGYDFLKLDTYTDAKDPIPLGIEIQDTGTKDYWTRVNYNAIVPPGKSTLILSLKQLFVGEKGRPGRNLILNGITRLVVSKAASPLPLFIDNLRLERDLTGAKESFEGLQAFDFGAGPVLDGFTPVTPATLYSSGRGYGLKNAKIWRSFNVLQPDPLYQDYICIESGGFAMDVPNGTWRVVVNVDAAAGFWGENQIYRTRTILAQGKPVVSERMDFDSFQKKYYYFWDKDDLPEESTFDKYGKVHFAEKTFDVEVKNGQLFIEFNGEAFANSVSSLIAFPVEKAAEGARFLEYTKEKRRFYFDNGFKRILHRASGDPLQPTAEDTRQGLVFFRRDLMKDIYYNDTPLRSETGKPLTGDGFPGQIIPLTAGVVPLKNLGHARVSISDLTGPGTIPASAIETGYGSYRVSRVTADGAVYTIQPRWIVPKVEVDLPKNLTRSLWFTVHIPQNAAAGVYNGKVTVTPAQGTPASMEVLFTVRKGILDAVNIPAGPFGGAIRSPWFEDDPLTAKFTEDATEKSLKLLRERGFTMYSGVPSVGYEIVNGKPTLRFAAADRQMEQARRLGFLAVNSYGAGITGLDNYFQDLNKMKASGYTDYPAFIRAIYTTVMKHSKEHNWIPVYWNLGDEPSDDDLKRAIENAQAYRAAFPQGPPYFTIPTSLFAGANAADPHFTLAKTIAIPALTLHNEPGVKLLLEQGGEWAYYNGASRWTYGDYLYKAVTQFRARFRIAWHWNLVAGDPYYALDCREDDSAWANSGPAGQLVPTIDFDRLSAGLDDYRALLTAARLAKAKAGTPAAQAVEKLIANRMASFHLNDLDHDAIFGVDDWVKFRAQLSDAIEALQ